MSFFFSSSRGYAAAQTAGSAELVTIYLSSYVACSYEYSRMHTSEMNSLDLFTRSRLSSRVRELRGPGGRGDDRLMLEIATAGIRARWLCRDIIRNIYSRDVATI